VRKRYFPRALVLLALTVGTARADDVDVQQAGRAVSAIPCAAPDSTQAADALAAQFDDHQFVFIHGTHGTAKIDEFLTCLITRPRFSSRVSDIVAEWASSAHQLLLDRRLLYLGPEPDQVLTGALPLTAERQRELDRRNAIMFGRDPQAYLRARYGGRDRWFRAVLVKQLAGDEAIAAADTLLLTVPNQLGIDYNAHVIESILKYVAPELGWR
jgi:hypothetical protein